MGRVACYDLDMETNHSPSEYNAGALRAERLVLHQFPDQIVPGHVLEAATVGRSESWLAGFWTAFENIEAADFD